MKYSSVGWWSLLATVAVAAVFLSGRQRGGLRAQEQITGTPIETVITWQPPADEAPHQLLFQGTISDGTVEGTLIDWKKPVHVSGTVADDGSVSGTINDEGGAMIGTFTLPSAPVSDGMQMATSAGASEGTDPPDGPASGDAPVGTFTFGGSQAGGSWAIANDISSPPQ